MLEIKQQKINANHLKIIAITAITIDHMSDLIYPGFPVQAGAIGLHIIGRLTAPMMWFFICEGYHYTRNTKKYILRLGIFAVISHFSYCFAFGIDMIPFRSGIFNQTSVMYPLFAAVLILWISEQKCPTNTLLRRIIIFLLISSAFPADWSCIAVLAILEMYQKRGNLKEQVKAMLPYVAIYAIVAFFFVNKVYSLVQIGVLLVYPILRLYNGEKGKSAWMKWFFYLYYPAHLIVIGIIRFYIYGNVGLLF